VKGLASHPIAPDGVEGAVPEFDNGRILLVGSDLL